MQEGGADDFKEPPAEGGWGGEPTREETSMEPKDWGQETEEPKNPKVFVGGLVYGTKEENLEVPYLSIT